MAPRQARASNEPEEVATAQPPPQPAPVEVLDQQDSNLTHNPVPVEVDMSLANPGGGKIMSLPTGENKTGVSSKAISTPTGPGTIQGMGESFSAQPSTGIATFSVPFSLPKARGAAQPSLSLGYSSSSGSGVAGIGWDVSVPFISRQTDRGLPRYDDQDSWHAGQDRFVYNGGQELVPVEAPLQGEVLPSWPGTWQYFRPRVEGSYLRFFWNRAQQLWRVQDKSGVTLELGGEANALEVDPESSTHVFRWNLRRQVDAYGNEVRYVYRIQGNSAYLQDIYDTSPAQAATENLAAWAHHTRIVYEDRPDPSSSYNRGWQVLRSLRVGSVDVTSVKDSTSSARKLVRRYHLGYDTNYHVSLLASVQVEGRCETDVAEQSDGTLPSTTCPRLPAMKLGYSHVGPATADMWEPIDSTLHTMQGSPKHSVDEDYTDLYDVNSDGLPDIVAMMPGTYGGAHGLWFNSEGGEPDKFGAQTTIGVKGVLGATESIISKHNPNVVALDLDADATINLVHMPKTKSYGVYTPEFLDSKWWWVGRPITTADQLDARIDFGADATELRVFDVNNDGLVDVVKSGGTSLQVWFSLGRYPGGDGLFGSAAWTGPDTASLSMEAVQRCVPWAGTPLRFSDSDVKLADMNGDGLTDIARVRPGDIKYWPGRGDGTFGTGALGCAGGTFSSGALVQMASSPQYSDPNGSALHLEDVNGDGLSDLVQVRFSSVDVWLNVDGSGWTDRRVIDKTPASPSFQSRVRLVDMNGSGTRDILWGDGYGYKYIDLSGGKRPWLLNRIENGLGKSTDIEFTTSTAQMLAAEKAGSKWTSVAPMPLHMVGRVTVQDNLAGIVGRPAGVYVTEYTYQNPVYDGLQREFRGFRKTDVATLGDYNSPTSISTSEFNLGERPTKFDLDCEDIDYRLPKNRWRDNPEEALKGLASTSETRDPASGVYLSTNHSAYTLRRLYRGRDGRSTWVAFESRTDGYLYDTAGFDNGPGQSTLPSVVREAADGSSCGKTSVTEQTQVTFRATARTAHVRKESTVDVFGNKTTETAYGTDGVDEVITTRTLPELQEVAANPNGKGWAWRTVESWVEGSNSAGVKRHHSKSHYDSYGSPSWSEVELTDPGSLDRFAPDAGTTAPTPTSASAAGWIVSGRMYYDSFGNVIIETGANDRCREVEYDQQHAQLPISETVYAGEPISTTLTYGALEVETECGIQALQNHADYDRGLQTVTEVVDPNDVRTSVAYDGFGRTWKLFKPRADGASAGNPGSTPSLIVEYHLPDETKRPVSMMISSTQDGAYEDSAEYHRTYAFVDGMGRSIVTLSEADPTVDEFQWVVEGLSDYDAKGAVRRKYLAWGYDGNAASYDLSTPAATSYRSQSYDAFGRPIRGVDLDQVTVTLESLYHAHSVDASDAEDLNVLGGPGVHYGTYASEEKDGHGRVIKTTERVRVGAGVEERYVESEYLPTGELVTITRRRGTDTVIRTMQYDSLGRMTHNLEPSTSSGTHHWRYVYDDSGNLVGTSDARGCGVNYAYDAAGRLLSEDYSPCEPHHEQYDIAAEVSYHYDHAQSGSTCLGTQGWTLGKLVAVTDRASKSITRYDARGRVVGVSKRVNGPDGETSTGWYCKGTSYDAADRPVTESTGATGNSTVTTAYSARGAVKSVMSSYGDLVNLVQRDADGLVIGIQYGDGANTATGFDYDVLRRLRNQTTYRSSVPDNPEPPNSSPLLLQDEEFEYDRVGNPVEIHDWRIAGEWLSGFKPVTRTMQYDDLYRLKRVDYTYPTGSDPWKDPYEPEVSDNTRPQPAPHGDFTGASRPHWQTWSYDWLGNTVASDDDEHGFYDRSLGTITNSTGDGGRYRFQSASNWSPGAQRGGGAWVWDPGRYDASGNLRSIDIDRAYNCIPADQCTSPGDLYQHYEYEWDEVGRLSRARRWDHDDWQAWDWPDAELRYAYDASDMRVRKTVVDGPTQQQRHTLYIFNSLEQRLVSFDVTDYETTEETEVPYLFAHGVRLARVVYTGAPDFTSPSRRVYLELGDHLGTNSVVIDLASGELVQRDTSYPYGQPESSYRPQRWDKFREDYRFTGKEDDIEVGLIYFGARYLNPQLGRWISADPLAVHAPGKADLNLYAYVHGKVLVAVDPTGLDGFFAQLGKYALGLGAGAVQAVKSTAVEGVKNLPQVQIAMAAKDVYHGDWKGAVSHAAVANPGGLAVKTTIGFGKAVLDVPAQINDAVNEGDPYKAGKKAFAPVSTIAAVGGLAFGAVRGAISKFKGGCFIAGTPVWTSRGMVPIERVGESDVVLAADDAGKGEVTWARIGESYRRKVSVIVELTLVDEAGNTTTLGTTTEHPFWRPDEGWVRAKHLLAGDHIRSANGWLSVRQAHKNYGLFVVYNLLVENEHTYFVGELGAWVHNQSSAEPVKPGDAGTYGDLKAQKRAFGETEPLDMDHQPSFAAQVRAKETALGRELEPDELARLRAETPAVALHARFTNSRVQHTVAVTPRRVLRRMLRILEKRLSETRQLMTTPCARDKVGR